MTGKGVPRFARYLRVRDDIVLKSFDYDKDEMKKKVCKILKALGDYEKMNKESFKASSYYKALKGINSMDKEFSLKNVSEVKGIGKSIYEKIEIIINTGTHPNYEQITEKKDPREDFMKIYGVGPGKAKDLMNMGYDSIQSLRDSQNLEEILNEKQLIGLNYYDDILKRIPYDEITEHEKFLKSVEALYKKGYMLETLALGNKKFMGISKISSELSGRRIDIMVTTKKEYPFAILYFTGSAEFNPKMRHRALDLGYSLNEYSLTDIKTKLDMDKEFLEEKDIFDFLKMEYVEPHLR
jgi:DNA polymerase/3'-5' exonuclease PolX